MVCFPKVLVALDCIPKVFVALDCLPKVFVALDCIPKVFVALDCIPKVFAALDCIPKVVVALDCLPKAPTDNNASTKRCCKFITEGFINCRWPGTPRNPFPPLMPTVHGSVSQTDRGILSPLLKSYNAL